MAQAQSILVRVDAAVLARLDALIARDYPRRSRAAVVREIIGAFLKRRG